MPVAAGPAVPLWLMVAGAKAVKLVWQVSHWAVVGICRPGFPVAWAPLWQVAQRPATGGVAVACSNNADIHPPNDKWQESHWALVGT